MKKVKVGITELQERLEVPVQIGISILHVAQQARSENGQKIFEVFWQEEEEVYVAQELGQMGCAVERPSRVGKKMSGQKSGNTNAEQKTKFLKNAIEGKLRVQSRASERLQDQIIEEIKANGTQEALQ